jgi:hypothetical protein
METRKDKYDYIINVEEEVLQRTKSYSEWREQERIKENMIKDIEWLDKNKHLLYDKNYLKTRVLISVGEWRYFTSLWKILAYLILVGLAIGLLAV